jgi:hypothetical protein
MHCQEVILKYGKKQHSETSRKILCKIAEIKYISIINYFGNCFYYAMNTSNYNIYVKQWENYDGDFKRVLLC